MRPYFGHGSGGKRATNLRSATALALARRLDPKHYTPGNAVWLPFHIPATEHWTRMREELAEWRQRLVGDKTELESKEDLMERLGRSPDYADALSQTFRVEAVAG